jgi:DUF1365 family protein
MRQGHVSPFMPMDVTYDWSFSPPSERLNVAMRCIRDSEPQFTAGLTLRRKEIDGAALAAALARHPFMTGKVIAAIHWQALRLWWRGCRTYVHPGKRLGARSS